MPVLARREPRSAQLRRVTRLLYGCLQMERRASAENLAKEMAKLRESLPRQPPPEPSEDEHSLAGRSELPSTIVSTAAPELTLEDMLRLSAMR